MYHKMQYQALLLALIGLIFFSLVSCQADQPILIGFSAQLTGRQSELGVATRNGAELAIEYVNQQGGINGRPLELVVRDDKGDAETARQVDAELVSLGVVALIGHPTSDMTAAVFDQMNQSGVVMLSPTSSSSKFSGQDDLFFRVIPSNNLMGKALAEHIFRNRGLRKIAGIYDLNNKTFTETLWQSLQAEFQRLGGDASLSFSFTSGKDDLKELIHQVGASQPDGIVFLASAVDTALMAQYASQQQINVPMFSSPWGQTRELIDKGGKAIEGMEFVAVYNPSHPSEAYQNFIKVYTDRYGAAPTLGASHGYEAVLVLAKALEQTRGKSGGLPEALKNIRDLPGLQGNIAIDQFGDVLREVYILRVETGQFQVIETINPAQ